MPFPTTRAGIDRKISARILVVRGHDAGSDVRGVVDALRDIADTTVAAGREAVDLLARLDPDVIVADQWVGEASGREFLEAAAAVCPNAACVLLEDAPSASASAASAEIVVLPKPVEREALRALIRLAMRSTALQRRLAALENRAHVVDEPEFDEAGELQSYEGILSRSPQMLAVVRTLKDLEDGDVSVLVQGETGTGKELVARAIHARSRRSSGPFVAVNLGAISDTLRESELFGHVRGAFTGAIGSRGGRFLEANHGSLFLDEVGDASPSLQAALLRALEERAVTPVGADRARPVDVRIISAPNRPLEDLVRRGGFRRDLYYRLNVFNIELPPLRERPEDIFPLANEFLERAARALGRQVAGISRDARRVLEEYRWEGNVRELRNVMERAAIVCRGGLIVAADLPVSPETKPDGVPPTPVFDFPPGGFRLRTIEQEIFRQTLAFAAGNQSRAARMLGLNESTFRFRLRKLGIATRAATGS